MKILLIHNYYQKYGGEDSVFHSEMELLKKNGHQILTFTRNNNEILKFSLLDKAKFLKDTIWSTKTNQELAKISLEFTPDVAHIHNIFPLISPSVYDVLKHNNIPIIQTLHNFRFLCSNGLFYRENKICEKCKFGHMHNAILFKCYKDNYTTSALYATTLTINRIMKRLDNVSCFIALSTFAKQKFSESKLIPEEKINVLGNFIDNNKAENLVKRKSKREYAVYIGRLSIEKGLDLIVNAFQELSNIELKIVGTGPEYEKIHRYLLGHNITNIDLLGHLHESEILEIARDAFVTVIPSNWYEQFPIVALESMLVGTPIIASRLGGLPSIIEDGVSGYLFEPNNLDDLKSKIIKMYSNIENTEQMGMNAQKTINDKFSSDVHYRKLMDIYNAAIIEKT
jgi:glycosyltransferase involved in cell wall biosynthesis